MREMRKEDEKTLEKTYTKMTNTPSTAKKAQKGIFVNLKIFYPVRILNGKIQNAQQNPYLTKLSNGHFCNFVCHCRNYSV